ncbi:hypothetical protein D3C71_696160 [compost metagenome]
MDELHDMNTVSPQPEEIVLCGCHTAAQKFLPYTLKHLLQPRFNRPQDPRSSRGKRKRRNIDLTPRIQRKGIHPNIVRREHVQRKTLKQIRPELSLPVICPQIVDRDLGRCTRTDDHYVAVNTA